jgi:regulator of protease activity HflC (stomatin/prohibitin superfamily)
VYTRDTVLVRVSTVMYYSIVDVRKAIYEVDDLTAAVSNTAQTQLKEVFGGMAFSEALVSQELINGHMKRNFKSVFEAWGLRVERIELQEISPLGRTSTAMKQQMMSERNRRADFIKAEGNKAAVRLLSEGDKMEKINLGVAEQEATRKRSEGRAAAQVEIARAEKAALDAVADAITADRCTQTEYMLAGRYNDLLRALMAAVGASSRLEITLPYEVSNINGIIRQLPRVYGRHASALATRPGGAGPNPMMAAASRRPGPAAAAAEGKDGMFSDLS